MRKQSLVIVPLMIVMAVTFAATAQVKQGKTRPLTTKQLMSGLVRPHASSLGADLKKSPSSDKEWAALATKAALLNEASYVLMADGRCPDGDWKGAADTLRECSGVVLKKIQEKDAEGAQKAHGAMMKACGACHKKHKK